MQKQFGGRGRAKVDKWTWSASVRDRLLSKMKMQNIRKKLVFALRFAKRHYKMLQNQQKLQGFCCKEHYRQKHLGMQHNWLSTAQWAVQKQKRLQTLVETFPKNLKLVLTLINLTSTTLPPISKDWWLSWVQSSWIWVRYSPRLLAKGCFCLLQVVMLHPVLLQVLLVWLVSLASFLLLSQCIHYISLAILTQFLPERMELIEQWIILFLFLFFIGGSAAQFFCIEWYHPKPRHIMGSFYGPTCPMCWWVRWWNLCFLVEPYLVELIKADWFPVIVENLPCCGMQYRCELTLVVTRMVNGDSGEAPFKNELFSIVWFSWTW